MTVGIEGLAPWVWLGVLPVAAAILDRDLRFVAVNERLADINGLDVAEHLGRHAMEVLPGIPDHVYAAFRSVMETGIAIASLLVVGETPAQPGVERSWREHVAPVLDAGGSVAGIVVTVEEITEQRRLSGQLESLVEAHAALARLGDVLVRASSRQEVVTSILAGSMVATGADRAALFERSGNTLRLVGASGLPDVVVQELREGPPENSLVDLVARSGEPFLLSTLDELRDRFPSVVPIAEAAGDRALAAVPLATESGVLGVLRLGFDAPHPFLPGERDRLLLLGSLAAQALLRSEAFEREIQSRRLLEEVVRQMPVGVSVTDPTGAVITRNPAVVAAWHGAPERPGVEDYGHVRGFQPDGRPYGARDWPIARSLEHGEVVVGELVDIERLDGSRAVVSLSSAPVRDADGTTIAGVTVVVDVTAERQAELAREAFIGTLSHEFGTPVTSIVAGAAVLAGRGSLDPEVAQSVAADVAAEATRLMRLVEDVLVLSRVERGVAIDRNDPVLVHQVARRVVAEEAERLPSLAIQLDVEPELPTVSGDETYVGQVLRNLLSNAAKYGDGHATVRVRRVDGGVELEVIDDGPGVDTADREHVFEPFYRADGMRSAPGAGIGLFICRRLVEAMGGTLTLRDGPPRGASFRMWLPVFDRQDAGELGGP